MQGIDFKTQSICIASEVVRETHKCRWIKKAIHDEGLTGLQNVGLRYIQVCVYSSV